MYMTEAQAQGKGEWRSSAKKFWAARRLKQQQHVAKWRETKEVWSKVQSGRDKVGQQKLTWSNRKIRPAGQLLVQILVRRRRGSLSFVQQLKPTHGLVVKRRCPECKVEVCTAQRHNTLWSCRAVVEQLFWVHTVACTMCNFIFWTVCIVLVHIVNCAHRAVHLCLCSCVSSPDDVLYSLSIQVIVLGVCGIVLIATHRVVHLLMCSG